MPAVLATISAGGVCAIDGTPLIQRSDDREEAVRQRLEVYAREIAPVIGFCREQGVLATVERTASQLEFAKVVLRGGTYGA